MIPIINKIVGIPVNGVPNGANNTLVYNGVTNTFQFVASVGLAHAEIYANVTGGGQTVATTFVVISQFNTNGASNSMTADQSGNRLVCLVAGDYEVEIHVPLTGGNNRIYTISAFVDGVEQVSCSTVEKHGTGADIDNIAFSGIVPLAIGEVLDVRIKQDAGSDTTTFQRGSSLHAFVI